MLDKNDTNLFLKSDIPNFRIMEHVTALVILLSKYSAYLSETVVLQFEVGSITHRAEFTISNEATFFEFLNEVQKKLMGVFEDENFTSLKVLWITDDYEASNYTIILSTNSGAYNLNFVCNENAFLKRVFKQSERYYNQLLQFIIKNKEVAIKELSFLSDADINEIQLISTGTIDGQIAAPELLHKLFEQTVERFPNGIAISFGNQQLTYNELNVKANFLADYFIKNGVKPGDFIGLHLKRSPEVYITMLGIMKAGAAYVPIDAGYPEGRVSYILQDANVKFLVSQQLLTESHLSFNGHTLYIEKEFKAIVNSTASISNPNVLQSFSTPAYIIYTSGSTGQPKGVLISHSAVSNLVKAERQLFQLNNKSKIAQGFSVAFDASVEEIWLAFSNGATLFPVTEEIMHSGNDLSDFITQHQISVLSTVPTMLSMMHCPQPSLRLLILGGENCPHELLAKWHSSNLRIANTYGPTEATVIATCADFNEHEKITIGKPITNYGVYITDAAQHLSAPGVPGELCIGGNSLATGYLNREELTKEKFITPLFYTAASFPSRVYRSGDLARYNEKGQIEFLGRIDSQVKLRGYRIELSEIEAQLLQLDEVNNAVVAVKEDEFKVQHLIAYIVLKDIKKKLNVEICKDKLKSKLAVYMIPSQFVELESFPVLPSGKVDRKKLPDPKPQTKHSNRAIVQPINELQTTIHSVWKKYFPNHQVSITDDFFDLGGHSLLASLVTSDLRKIQGFERASIQDIYNYRTIEKIASCFANNNSGSKPVSEKKKKTERVSSSAFAGITILQSFSFYILLLVSSTGLLSSFIVEALYPDITPYALITISSLLVISTFPALMIVSILVKWLVIGRFKEGHYPLWGGYYFRFWLVKKFIDLTPLGLLAGTPFLNFYFKLLGAKIGKNVYLGSDRIRVFDLFAIDDGSSISREAHLTGYHVDNGELIIGKINIGKNCFVGTRTALGVNTAMQNNSTLGELSLLPNNNTIPVAENWEGSPAQKVSISKLDNLKPKQVKSAMPYSIYLFMQFLAVLFLLMFPLALMIPFGLTLYEMDLNFGFQYALLITIPSAAVYVTLFCVFVALVKWLIIGKTKEEDFSIYSFRYIQKWTVDMILHFVLGSFKSIYATIYLPSWLRLMGAKVGKRAEISTVNQLSTDLLEIGEGSFLADSVSVGSPVVRDGVMFLRKTTIGSKTFIGNSAVLACGDTVGNDSLIGVLSVPPKSLEPEQLNNSSWLGSPSMFLPQRQQSQEFDPKFTFNPTKDLIFKRGFIEFFKITLPLAFTIGLIAAFYKIVYDVLLIESFSVVVMIAPVLLFLLTLVTPIVTVVFKKILIGTYKPSNKPLWSVFVWNNELVNSLCESMVYPSVVNMFLGTPYAPWFFRMMGCKIGKRVFMETTEITEFDLVHIDDDVSLNQSATIQTHLFEDRVMKMSNLYIKNGCTLGAMAVVLYDSTMEEGASIDALSLVMKGESIPAHTQWAGSPAKFVSND